VTRRCDCHDLLPEDCEALLGALTRERAAAIDELERLARLIALPGIVPAAYPGRCGKCGQPFLQGSPIKRYNAFDGAYAADCCLDDNGRITTA
jgi:hypothetical protein